MRSMLRKCTRTSADAFAFLDQRRRALFSGIKVEIGESVRLELTQRIASEPVTDSAKDLDLPPIHIVDMRSELKSGNRGVIFSRELTDALSLTLTRWRTSHFIFESTWHCHVCLLPRYRGHVIKCPRGDTPLTYHVSSGEQLLCHRCGYERQMPKRCPQCNGANIRAVRIGKRKSGSRGASLVSKSAHIAVGLGNHAAKGCA